MFESARRSCSPDVYPGGHPGWCSSHLCSFDLCSCAGRWPTADHGARLIKVYASELVCAVLCGTQLLDYASSAGYQESCATGARVHCFSQAATSWGACVPTVQQQQPKPSMSNLRAVQSSMCEPMRASHFCSGADASSPRMDAAACARPK